MTRERGFTYVEVIVSLSALVVLIPALFFTARTMESEIRKMAGRQRLEMEVLSFVPLIEQDVKRGIRFRAEGGALVIGQPDGSSVRYENRKRRVIRKVKAARENAFKGVTVVLDDVYFVAWVPDENGVMIDLGLQNWSASLDVNLYLARRTEDPDAPE